MKPEDLVGVQEIAAIIERSYRTAQLYVSRDDFPEPWGEWALGRLWRRRDVELWAKRTMPFPTGRPPRD